MSKTKSKKIWIEYLRVLAIIAVITIHVTTSTYNNFGQIELLNWLFASFLNSFSRFAVPIFVMVSGCVLLGRDVKIKKFYVSRGMRLIPAILFWSLFYVAFDYIYNNPDLSSMLWKLKFGIFISGQSYYHLWYLSMYLCLMLFFPFINNYILGRKPSIEDFYIIIGIFSLFMMLNQISIFMKEVLHIGITWFKSFPWFIGYFIIGYFIDTYTNKIKISNLTTIIIIFIILALTNILNFYSSSALGIVKDTLIINNVGIFDFILTISIFYLFSNNREIFKENNLVSSISSMSFGIYLIHPVFMEIFFRNLNPYVETTLVYLPLLVFITFSSSYLAILVFTKFKWFKALC
ncbi:MAG: acyltransferase family protein [Methyloprofundus sp.]|nr:acyltransferase family protein [Methyloprofundus sp.]